MLKNLDSVRDLKALYPSLPELKTLLNDKSGIAHNTVEAEGVVLDFTHTQVSKEVLELLEKIS